MLLSVQVLEKNYPVIVDFDVVLYLSLHSDIIIVDLSPLIVYPNKSFVFTWHV